MVLGPTLHEQSVRERMPGRPGFESRRGRQQVHGYNCSTTVPRSLGGQDSRFSLSQLCVAHAMQTLIFFARKHPHWAWPFDWVRLPACDTPPLLVWFSWS